MIDYVLFWNSDVVLWCRSHGTIETTVGDVYALHWYFLVLSSMFISLHFIHIHVSHTHTAWLRIPFWGEYFLCIRVQVSRASKHRTSTTTRENSDITCHCLWRFSLVILIVSLLCTHEYLVCICPCVGFWTITCRWVLWFLQTCRSE